MDNSVVDELSGRELALVAIGVLLDGQEASAYLKYDQSRGHQLVKAAEVLAAYPLELRMPYVGTYLRSALKSLEDVS